MLISTRTEGRTSSRPTGPVYHHLKSSGAGPAPLVDPSPTQEQVQDNVESLMIDHKEVHQEFEETWKRLREKSFRAIENRKVKGGELLKMRDMVLIWIPTARRSKTGNRWEGPFPVEFILSNVRVRVNGKEEHVHNLKICTGSRVGVEDSTERKPGEEDFPAVEKAKRPKR